MGSVRVAAFAGAVLIAGVQMVAAADLPPIMQKAPSAPVMEFGGWYLRGDIGFSNEYLRGHRFDPTPLPPLDSDVMVSGGFDSAGIFDLGFGYQFNSWLRADVTGQFRGKAHFHALDVISSGNNTSPEQTFASKSEWVFLANVYADLGTWWYVTPFVGAGVGFDNVRITNWQDIGVESDANNFADSGSKWNFAWAAHAGLGYRVNPNLTLELAYHFLSLGDGRTGPVHGWDGSYQGAGDHFNRIYSHDLTMGVRWMFAAPPPAEPFYPLVRKG
jgi:opacity protein-like surface antigen